MLGRDEFVLERSRLSFRLGDGRGCVGRKIQLGAFPEDLGLDGQGGLGIGLDRVPIDANAVYEGGDDAFLLH